MTAPTVCVPVEPTPKMVDATWNDPAEAANGGGIESHNTRNRRIYAAMIAAAPAPPQAVQGEAVAASESVRKLVGALDQWRLCMSHNESYFGEPAGLLKATVAELAREVAPIYPPEPEPADPLAGVTIYTATVALPPTPAMPIAASGDVEQRARELLAAEYERDGSPIIATRLRESVTIRYGDAIALRTISAAMRSQGQAVTEEMIARGIAAIAPPVIRGESTYRSTVIDILTAALAQQANKDAPKASA